MWARVDRRVFAGRRGARRVGTTRSAQRLSSGQGARTAVAVEPRTGRGRARRPYRFGKRCEPPRPTRCVRQASARAVWHLASAFVHAEVVAAAARSLGREQPPMRGAQPNDVPGSARTLACAGCGLQVLVCSRCDRGQRYCGRPCAEGARRESLRRAGRRYQRSRRGRLAHARRAWAYRRRRAARQIVTHQGSQLRPACATVTTNPTHDAAAVQVWQDNAGSPPEVTTGAEPASAWRCHWCRRGCMPPLRRGWLRRGRVHRSGSQRASIHGRPP